MQTEVTPAIRRMGRPAAVARRAARRVATHQMPQAYPPKRGVGKRAAEENARTASLAVEWWDFWRHGLKRPLGNCLDSLMFGLVALVPDETELGDPFLDANDWDCELLIGRRSHPLDQCRMARAAAVAKDGQMIRINEDHARREKSRL